MEPINADEIIAAYEVTQGLLARIHETSRVAAKFGLTGEHSRKQMQALMSYARKTAAQTQSPDFIATTEANLKDWGRHYAAVCEALEAPKEESG